MNKCVIWSSYKVLVILARC